MVMYVVLKLGCPQSLSYFVCGVPTEVGFFLDLIYLWSRTVSDKLPRPGPSLFSFNLQLWVREVQAEYSSLLSKDVEGPVRSPPLDV